MKNRIYIFNLGKEIPDITLALDHYDVHLFEGEIESFALNLAQGIILFDPNLENAGRDFGFVREVILVSRKGILDLVDPERFLSLLDREFGRERIVNPKQFEIIPGSVVRSKVQPQFGAGFVTSIRDDEVIVNFPKAGKVLTQTDFVCHKSVLRVISHIKEVANERE